MVSAPGLTLGISVDTECTENPQPGDGSGWGPPRGPGHHRPDWNKCVGLRQRPLGKREGPGAVLAGT